MFTILENIVSWFKKLFNITPKKSNGEQADENLYVENYRNMTETINITAVIAVKLCNIIGAESKIEVKPCEKLGENNRANPRIDFLNASLQRVVDDLNLIIMRTLGIGGIVLKPYIYNGQIYVDILPQNRFFITEQVGKVIIKAGFIADYIKSDNIEYMRIEYHSLDENINSQGEFGLPGESLTKGQYIYSIENRAVKNGVEIPLESVPEWAGIAPVMTISGVDRMLFAFVKCPVDNRKTELNAHDSIYGVPITYGQDKLIKYIIDILNEIPDEYKNKKTFIGADELLFSDKNKLPSSGLYKLFRSGGGVDKQSFWEIFSPEIRQTSYFEGVNHLLGLLEKAIGVNRGLLTDLATRDATARAIEQSSFDTEALADAMHKNIETAFGQLVYAFNVLANAFMLGSPSGTKDNLTESDTKFGNAEFIIKYDWMNLSERSSDRATQLLNGIAVGAVNAYEYRQYVFDESKEEAMANLPEQLNSQNLLLPDRLAVE